MIAGRRRSTAVVALALVLAACSATEDPGTSGGAASDVTEVSSASAVPPMGSAPSIGRRSPADVDVSETMDDGYEWRRVPIGAGGFVTGIVSATTPERTASIYARTDVGGAYRWNANTSTWVQMLRTGVLTGGELGPSDYSVASIAVAPSQPDVVYVLVGDDFNPDVDGELVRGGRVLSSRDGGRTWRTSAERWFVSGNQRYRMGSERLAVDPLDPDRVYVGTQREGLWRSDDGGVTWDQIPLADIPAGLSDDLTDDQAGVSLVAFGPPDGQRPSALHIGVANEGIYALDRDGDSWTTLVALSAGEVPSSSAWTNAGHMLAVNTPERADAARLIRIDSAGRTTEFETPAGSGTWHLAVDPVDSRRMVLAGDGVRDGHLWTSDDGGATWHAHEIEISSTEIPWLERTDLETWMSTGRLMYDPITPGRVWFAEGMGVWVTDDIESTTVTWTSVAHGIEQVVVSGGIAPPDRAVIVTVADRQGFRFDGIESYPTAPLVDDRFASGSGADYSAGDPDVIAWVGAESNIAFSPDREPRGAVSSDGGRTWREMDGLSDDMYGGEVAVSATDSDNIVWLPTHHSSPVAYLEDRLPAYVSNDGGRSWASVSVGNDSDSFHRFFWWFGRKALAADRVDGSFYLMSNEETFYVSRDGGGTWSDANFSPPCVVDNDCHVFGQIMAQPGAAGRVWAATGRGGLYRSDDAGETAWTKIDGVEEVRLFTVGAPTEPGRPSAIYVYGRASQHSALNLLRSTDDGDTWSTISEFPFDLAMNVSMLVGDGSTPGRIYLGFSGGGVVVGDGS